MGLIKTDGIREVLGVTGEAEVGGSEMTGYQKVNFSVLTLYIPYLPTLIVWQGMFLHIYGIYYLENSPQMLCYLALGARRAHSVDGPLLLSQQASWFRREAHKMDQQDVRLETAAALQGSQLWDLDNREHLSTKARSLGFLPKKDLSFRSNCFLPILLI